MGALQVWQSLSEAQGRGHGDRDVAILFTDLVDFSDWALDAGDAAAVELLRKVGAGRRAAGQGARRPGRQAARRRADGGLRGSRRGRARGVRGERRRSAGSTAPACAPASTSAARASSAATTSASTSTSRRASPRRPAAARCWSPTPCASGSTPSRSRPAAAGGSSRRARRRASRPSSPSPPADPATTHGASFSRAKPGISCFVLVAGSMNTWTSRPSTSGCPSRLAVNADVIELEPSRSIAIASSSSSSNRAGAR